MLVLSISCESILRSTNFGGMNKVAQLDQDSADDFRGESATKDQLGRPLITNRDHTWMLPGILLPPIPQRYQ
jgi:hypothetical protein